VPRKHPLHYYTTTTSLHCGNMKIPLTEQIMNTQPARLPP